MLVSLTSPTGMDQIVSGYHLLIKSNSKCSYWLIGVPENHPFNLNSTDVPEMYKGIVNKGVFSTIEYTEQGTSAYNISRLDYVGNGTNSYKSVKGLIKEGYTYYAGSMCNGYYHISDCITSSRKILERLLNYFEENISMIKPKSYNTPDDLKFEPFNVENARIEIDKEYYVILESTKIKKVKCWLYKYEYSETFKRLVYHVNVGSRQVATFIPGFEVPKKRKLNALVFKDYRAALLFKARTYGLNKDEKSNLKKLVKSAKGMMILNLYKGKEKIPKETLTKILKEGLE